MLQYGRKEAKFMCLKSYLHANKKEAVNAIDSTGSNFQLFSWQSIALELERYRFDSNRRTV